MERTKNKLEARSKKLIVRMSPSEHSEFKALAKSAGVTISAMIRHQLEDAKLKIDKVEKVVEVIELTPDHASLIHQLTLELSRIGTDLNQIARQASKTDGVNLQVLQSLNHIREHLNRLQKCISNL